MKRLNAFFLQSFGVPLASVIPLPSQELFPLTKDGLVYGSASAKRRTYLAQMEITDFLASGERGYFLIGYWGHGSNSYAFYYSRIDDWSHIFFRLGYGGMYMDNDQAALHVRRFLTSYFLYEPELKRSLKSLVAIDSMYHGDYTLELPDGRKLRLQESLYSHPNFRQKLSRLIQS